MRIYVIIPGYKLLGFGGYMDLYKPVWVKYLIRGRIFSVDNEWMR